MVLQAASTAAFFVNQVGQAPVVMQCAQAAQDVGWKWWLGALAPWIGPLLSGVVSIYVAWRVFGWQARKDRLQWIRDQKMREWKSLVDLTAEFERAMPLGEPGRATVDGVRHKVLPLCDRISHLASQALFIAPTLSAHGIRPELNQIMLETDSAIGRIEIFDQSSQSDKMKLGTPVSNATEIRRRLQELHAKIVSLAHTDLFLV